MENSNPDIRLAAYRSLLGWSFKIAAGAQGVHVDKISLCWAMKAIRFSTCVPLSSLFSLSRFFLFNRFCRRLLPLIALAKPAPPRLQSNPAAHLYRFTPQATLSMRCIFLQRSKARIIESRFLDQCPVLRVTPIQEPSVPDNLSSRAKSINSHTSNQNLLFVHLILKSV